MNFETATVGAAQDAMTGSLVSAQARASRGSRKDMEAAAKEFEAVFMAQMLKPMWEGLESDPVFGGGAGEDVMRDFLVQEYGKSMAAGSNSGLSQAILDEMIRFQEQKKA